MTLKSKTPLNGNQTYPSFQKYPNNKNYPNNKKDSCKQENSETFGKACKQENSESLGKACNQETSETQEDFQEKISQNAVSDLITGLTLLGAALIIAVFFGFLCYNTRLENEYDSEHTFVKCWKTGDYVCTQDHFGGCARYEPETRCQRFRKEGSPTFKEWKTLRGN